MDMLEVVKELAPVVRAEKDKPETGERIKIVYRRIPGSKITLQQEIEAQKAVELGVPWTHYTGHLVSTWYSKDGDYMVTLFVTVEREGKYRTFNVNRGVINEIVKL